MSGEGTVSDYGMKIVIGAGPWIVLGVICFITLILLLVCTYCCCCCQSKVPKMEPRISKIDKFCQLFLFLVCIGSSLAGIIISRQFVPSISQTQCAITKFFYEFKEGNEEANWLGVTEIKVRM